MKNPLKHQSAPVASRQPNHDSHPPFQRQYQNIPTPPASPLQSQTSPKRGHTHSNSFGNIFQGLTFRRRTVSQSPSQDSVDSFHIIHQPDRPIVPTRQSQVPSEEDCRLILQSLHHSNSSGSISGSISEAQAKTRVTTRRSDLPFKATSLDPHTSFAARIAAGASFSSVSKTAKQSVRRVAAPSSLSQRKGSSATAPTNASRQRQGNVGQAVSRQVGSAPSSQRPASEKPPVRTPIRTSASSVSSVNTDRPLPPLPLTPTRQQKHHQSLPPPGPLSRRPLLPLNERPTVRSSAIVTSKSASTSTKTPTVPFEPRRFHMHGQTYDNAMAPYKTKAEVRPASRSTERARIGPMTEAELAPSKPTDSRPASKQSTTPRSRPQAQPSRMITLPERKAAEEKERRQLMSKSLQLRKPELWSPKHSSPLRQSHPTPSSPRPQSGEVSPLTPPSRSPVSSFDPIKASAKKQVAPMAVATKPAEPEEELLEWDIEVIKASRIKAHAELYEEKDEPLLGYDIETIKQAVGWGDAPDEPLLEWDAEAIKASMTRTYKKPATTANGKAKTVKKAKKTVRFENVSPASSSESLPPLCNSSSSSPSSSTSSKPNTNICWDKDPRANRAADASSSTAIPMLIKALTLLPAPTKEKYGVVAIDTVVQKRPQIMTSHSGSDDDAGSECSFLAAEQYVEIGDMGDYAQSWPESDYYFGDHSSMPTIDESPSPTTASSTQTHDQSVSTTTTRSSTSATSTCNTRSRTSEQSRWQAHQRHSSRRDTNNMF